MYIYPHLKYWFIATILYISSLTCFSFPNTNVATLFPAKQKSKFFIRGYCFLFSILTKFSPGPTWPDLQTFSWTRGAVLLSDNRFPGGRFGVIYGSSWKKYMDQLLWLDNDKWRHRQQSSGYWPMAGLCDRENQYGHANTDCWEQIDCSESRGVKYAFLWHFCGVFNQTGLYLNIPISLELKPMPKPRLLSVLENKIRKQIKKHNIPNDRSSSLRLQVWPNWLVCISLTAVARAVYF